MFTRCTFKSLMHSEDEDKPEVHKNVIIFFTQTVLIQEL